MLRWIWRFEDGVDRHGQTWLGHAAGFALGLLLLLLAAGMTALAALVIARSHSKELAIPAWMIVLAGVTAYWRRQRLAAHFEHAHRRLRSDDPDERQRALLEMIINARRGRGEHRRIARALTAYLRRPPLDHPDETGRRRLAFSLLADYTLAMFAKQGLDLTGAALAGVPAVNAELPGVCLRDADLRGARFAHANLEGANLRGARLDDADFTGARLKGTILETVL